MCSLILYHHTKEYHVSAEKQWTATKEIKYKNYCTVTISIPTWRLANFWGGDNTNSILRRVFKFDTVPHFSEPCEFN